MPLFDHSTIGDIQNHVFLKGIVIQVYRESDDTPEEKWDTADIRYENTKIFLNAAIRYHCTPTGVNRANGSIVDGAKGFDVDDQVIVMARIGTTPGMGEEYDRMYVIAHQGGRVQCAYNYIFIRVSPNPFIDHNPPYGVWKDGIYEITNPGSHIHEYCTVWDAERRKIATIYDPVTQLPYEFPVTVESFKPALDYYLFQDEEMFILDSQGDAQIKEAGFSPNWEADFQGEKIRDGAPADAWWTSYDIYANPILSLFSDMEMSLALDSEGAHDGSFSKVIGKLTAAHNNIQGWKAASPNAFNDDTREFDVVGSEPTKTIPPDVQARLQELQVLIGKLTDLMFNTSPSLPQYLIYRDQLAAAQAETTSILAQTSFTPWAVAHDKDGNPLKGRSYHLQTGFGEDEIWVCAKETFRGIVVSWCDEKWKFIRFPIIPPAMGIGNPHLLKLSSGGGLGTPSMADMSMAMAASTTSDGDNNIFSWGTLKRINDGGLHRTSHPALKSVGFGSWRMTQNKIPGALSETTSYTALNTRYECIDIWHRYDNWMNTLQYSSATFGVDRTWWFKSNAQQWRIKATFIDTPIGNMWYSSPVWEAGLWYMTGFQIFPGGPTCRKDVPTNTRLTMQCKHSKRVAAQIYIVQRQGVTMWDDPTRMFVLQEINKGIYDHFPQEDVKYVSSPPGGENNDDYNTLTLEQKQELLSERVFLRSSYSDEEGYDPPQALRNNRNEIEIMAACDTYSSLKANFGQCNPTKQVRSGDLEFEIEKLLAKYHSDEGVGIRDFSEFNFEARIV